LGEFVNSEHNLSNQHLLDENVVISITGEINVTNQKAGGTIEFGEMMVSTNNTFAISVDNLVVGLLTASNNAALSHHGGSKEMADSTIIRNIKSTHDFTLRQLYSDDVDIYSDGIGGNLIIQGGKTGNNEGRIELAVNDVRTRIDAVDKRMQPEHEFRFWTLDGRYSLTSSLTGVAFSPDSSMRLLTRSQMNLTSNGDAFYTDSAFGNLNAHRWLIEEIIRLASSRHTAPQLRSESIINSQLLFQPTDDSDNSPFIVPIINNTDTDKEKEELSVSMMLINEMF
jgi:hypothetical protein